jgi:hypothetical protein
MCAECIFIVLKLSNSHLLCCSNTFRLKVTAFTTKPTIVHPARSRLLSLVPLGTLTASLESLYCRRFGAGLWQSYGKSEILRTFGVPKAA